MKRVSAKAYFDISHSLILPKNATAMPHLTKILLVYSGDCKESKHIRIVFLPSGAKYVEDSIFDFVKLTLAACNLRLLAL